MHLFRVGELVREPGLIVEPHCVHHQRVSLPMSDGMAGPCGLKIFRMRAPVQIDLAESGDIQFKEHGHECWSMNRPERRAGTAEKYAEGQAVRKRSIFR